MALRQHATFCVWLRGINCHIQASLFGVEHMPVTPLTVPNRLVFKYTVNGLQHVCQLYATLVGSGDATGYDAVARPAYVNPGCSGLCDAFFNAVKAFYKPANCSFDVMEGQIRVGTAWSFLFAVTPTVAPTGAGTPENAFGLVLAGKDVAHRNLPAMLYEGDFGSPAKFTAYAPRSAVEKALIDYFWNVGGGVGNTAAYVWRQSRGGQIPQRWISWVVDTNEKLRRVRGIK
jgi:hypothetical protein